MATTPETLEKVQALIRLSQSKDSKTNEPTEEARTAAVQATALMAQHKLVLIPLSEIERVQKAIGEAGELAKKYEGEKTQRLVLGAVLGAMAVKQGFI